MDNQKSSILELLEQRNKKIASDVTNVKVYTSSNAANFFLKRDKLYEENKIQKSHVTGDRILSISKEGNVTVIVTNTYKYEYVIDELMAVKSIYEEVAGGWKLKHLIKSDDNQLIYNMADAKICEELGKLPRLINWKGTYCECHEDDIVLLQDRFRMRLEDEAVMKKLLDEDLNGRIAYAASMVLIPNSTKAGYNQNSAERRRNASGNGGFRRNRTQELNEAIQASTLDETSE